MALSRPASVKGYHVIIPVVHVDAGRVHLGQIKGFCPGVNRERCSFYDCFPFEYPTGGVGDFRESCLGIRTFILLWIIFMHI